MNENNQKTQKLTSNQIAIHTLLNEGLNKASIAKELNISRGYVTQVSQQANKYNLAKSKHVKAAVKTIVALSQGQPIGIIATVKDSTALAAAGMIYERYDPSITRIEQDVRTQSISINHDTISAMTEYLSLKQQIDSDKQQNVIDISINDTVKVEQV